MVGTYKCVYSWHITVLSNDTVFIQVGGRMSIIFVLQFTDHSVPLVAIVLAIRTFSHKRTNVILPH